MKLVTTFTLGLMLSLPAFALPARIVNAKQETRSASSGLERLLEGILASQTEPAWVGVCSRGSGWALPDVLLGLGQFATRMQQLPSRRKAGRSAQCQRRAEECETRGACRNHRALPNRTETTGEDSGVFAGCELDFGSLPLIWLNEVKPAESLRWLGSVATDAAVDNQEGRRRADGAVTAIAHHQGSEADRLLETLAAASRPLELRKQAAFWMGTIRGRTGYETLRRLVREDTNEKFREHVVFALSQSQEPRAVLTLIQAAREDASARVRGQVLFWLAHKAGRRAAAAIAAAIDQDPETQVKKKAVFALHQLPKDEGVPLLIQVARNNKNPMVRKEAMFWLGQSNDSRALAFFEEVLSK